MRALTFACVALSFFSGLSVPALTAQPAAPSVPTETTAPLPAGLYAEFITPHGTVVTELFYQQTPLTVSSFVGLAEGVLTATPGQAYFNGLKFHRVVPGFVVQGGDPLGTGEGGPGYSFPDEFVPGLRHDAVGILSMANAGPDTNGSQFFFTLAPVNRLNYLHSVFGRVVRGLELLPRIQQGDTFSVRILRVGAQAEAFHVTKESFSTLVARAPKAAPDHFADPENVLPLDPPRARAFNNKLANLERATGAKVYGRLIPKTDPAEAEAKPGTIAKRIATELGIVNDGVLAVYLVDRDTWALWIADSKLAKFLPEGTTAATSLHDRKQAFIAQAKTRAALVIAKAEKAAPPDKPLLPAQKIKLQIDEVLDGLIALFENTASVR